MAQNNEGAAFVAGIAIGVVVMELFSFFLVVPTAHDDQFKKDCVKMAHGTVSDKECVKGNTILFHE